MSSRNVKIKRKSFCKRQITETQSKMFMSYNYRGGYLENFKCVAACLREFYCFKGITYSLLAKGE